MRDKACAATANGKEEDNEETGGKALKTLVGGHQPQGKDDGAPPAKSRRRPDQSSPGNAGGKGDNGGYKGDGQGSDQ